MGVCSLCGYRGKTVSDVIGVCVECLRKNDKALEIAMEVHRRYRESWGLPTKPPKSSSGVRCNLCVNECIIPLNGYGFCGVWKNENGVLKFIEGYGYGVLHAYLDPLPTNCVATPVCPAVSGAGYPKYSLSQGIEYGHYNLAVFFAGCNLDCLFCQNWQHKDIAVSPRLRKRYLVSVDQLVEETTRSSKIACLCFFGGDPAPHAIYSISVSRKILDYIRKTNSVKRICWETNGLENPSILREMARLSLESGGIVKIDWKAYTPQVYQALSGVDGFRAVERVKENVKIVAEIGKERPEIPLLVVSILLVPGYVDEIELEGMARYIASVDVTIPVVLLAFHSDHLLRDLPPTSVNHAQKAYKLFKEHGIERVFVGNEWLLGPHY